MAQKRLATLTLTTSYQQVSELLRALPSFSMVRILTSGALKVAAASANPIRISIPLPTASTGEDGSSNLYGVGESLYFTEIDLTYVWVKGSGGAATLEIEGDEA